MINLPAELGWISKNLPLGPRPSGCALGPRALGQVFTDPPSLCWQVYPRLLPAHINGLGLAYWTTISERNQACARLKRYMKRAEDRGAGPSGLPDPRALRS